MADPHKFNFPLSPPEDVIDQGAQGAPQQIGARPVTKRQQLRKNMFGFTLKQIAVIVVIAVTAVWGYNSFVAPKVGLPQA